MANSCVQYIPDLNNDLSHSLVQAVMKEKIKIKTTECFPTSVWGWVSIRFSSSAAPAARYCFTSWTSEKNKHIKAKPFPKADLIRL